MLTVIEHARLIDATGRPPVSDAAVVIEDRRIRAVVTRAGNSIPRDATIIDASGRAVVPGLMDLHGGICAPTEAERPYGMTQKNVAAAIIRGVSNGRRCLNAGVTTVRVDTCGHHGIFALKEAFASGVVDGPRLFVPGRGITMTGGHSWANGACEVDGPDAVRRAAREQLKAGADWVKLYATGGAGSATERVDDEQFTTDELKAAVEEAHKKGRFAYAHVSCAQGARNCIVAGIDSIEHGLFLEEDIVRDMKEKGIFLVPTLGAYLKLVEKGEKGGVPEYMYKKACQAVDAHKRSFQMAMRGGVKIATGTDSGGSWYPMGESLLYEMEIMNQYGMPSMEVLIAATSRAAQCLRVTDDLGTLEPGKIADILIVDGDPLTNVSDLRNTWMVLKEGRIVFQK